MRNLPRATASLVLLLLLSCGPKVAPGGQRMIVLGFDGMDYTLTQQLMAAGRLPNLARLASEGGFQSLATAVPPQSPVAWSNFITGMDAGGHGIFDFIHRDPNTLLPYLSTSHTEGAEKTLKVGKYQVPLSGGKVELLRHGQPFWDVLEQRGVPTTVLRMPANFPPSGQATRELSGMGTPDILGTPGTFTYYTSELFAYYGRTLNGGTVHEVYVEDGKVSDKLYGPTNPFLIKPEPVTVDFTVYIDPKEPVVKLVVGDEERVLKLGEWSNWVPIEFELVPTQTLGGIARFYLKQLQPEFQLFVSPINFDPAAPALPISNPEDYAAELAEATGRFYTQEMPEDTKAYKEGIFSTDEFLTQAKFVVDHMLEQYEYVLSQFDSGLLFYYFGNTDQVAHMMWRTLDPEHPAYSVEKDGPYKEVIPKLYEKFDGIVGMTLERMGPNTTLVVMSDHGFSPWRRAVSVNTWLKDNGYLVLRDPTQKTAREYLVDIDWSKTRAYALGLNGLYINLKGREKNGVVEESERQALIQELAAKLLEMRDPENGARTITKMYPREATYRDRGYEGIGPDLQIGYARTYRAANESAAGGLTENQVFDNLSAWSGDHCMDHEAVPGVLFTSRPLKKKATSLKDLGAALLAEFGVDGFPVATKH